MTSFSRSCVLTVISISMAAALHSQSASAGSAPLPILNGIPGPLIWQHPPVEWKIDNGDTLSITGGKGTDWFVSPMGDGRSDNSSRLLFKPAKDFVLSAKVDVGFRSQWDAGVLALYVNDELWAKLCFEMTIEKHPAIVSVVTKGLSDDNNSIAIEGNSVYLKVAKAGQAIFFYASQDGKNWSIIRAFSLGANPDLRVGFSSQSPVANGCTTVFSDIHYLVKRVDLWSGK
jgi:regulation of enolase protein 1 (concanavalin A-like superfamily)